MRSPSRSKAHLRAAALLVAMLLVAAALAGCGGGSEGPATTPAPEPAAVPIEYTVSGGFPPFAQRLRIDPDGKARLVLTKLEGSRRMLSFELPPPDLQRIRELLAAAAIGELSAPELSCADCVVYDISYAGESLTADMLTIPPELQPAFDRLDAVIEGA